ncbi:hypothetical protein ACLOJK_037421 [Asimina triloba]
MGPPKKAAVGETFQVPNPIAVDDARDTTHDGEDDGSFLTVKPTDGEHPIGQSKTSTLLPALRSSQIHMDQRRHNPEHLLLRHIRPSILPKPFASLSSPATHLIGGASPTPLPSTASSIIVAIDAARADPLHCPL